MPHKKRQSRSKRNLQKNQIHPNKVVIDTNVLIRADQWSLTSVDETEIASRNFIAEFIETKDVVVFVDSTKLIATEYTNNLGFSGKPGIGKAFVKWLHDYQYSSTKCRVIECTQQSEFELNDYPTDQNGILDTLDVKDRKFVVVSHLSQEKPHIVNASDSDWVPVTTALQSIGIVVHQLC